MSKIDYGYKSYVLKEHSDLLKKQKRASLYDYAVSKLVCEGVVSYALKTNKDGYSPSAELMAQCAVNGLMEEYNECIKINRAEYERVKRLKSRVKALLQGGKCIFLTLTFTDDTLAKTTPKQRRVAVTRYLKQFSDKYIGNIDFGVDKTKTMREHYHAIIQCESVVFDGWRKYGNINAKVVRNKNIDDDKTKLAKYVSKLSNHAIKENAKRSSLIYGRTW